MITIVLVICVAVFAIAAVICAALAAGPSETGDTMAGGFLQEVPPLHSEPGAADIRRKEQLSGIGWLNRLMVRINVAPRIRLFLSPGRCEGLG